MNGRIEEYSPDHAISINAEKQPEIIPLVPKEFFLKRKINLRKKIKL